MQRLYLSSNQISDEGATAPAHAVKRNTSLQTLFHDHNQISDKGATTLPHALSGNTKLSIYDCGRWFKPFDKPKDTATIPESGAVEGDNMFADAELDEEEECGLPLHAAIKFGQEDDLMELLESRDEVDVNQLDSKERTPADFAALCGEEDLLELIQSHGGKFHVKSAARMRAIARKRAPYATERLNSILEAL